MTEREPLLVLRFRLGLTRKQAADLAGITPNQLLGLEIGSPEVMGMEKRVREVLEALLKEKRP
jgi:transcriptional regulator with XRE-family HTH domain